MRAPQLRSGDPPWTHTGRCEVARPPLPAPAAGWETCAASWLEWDARAAAPLDLLFLAYASWCASHGEPVLAEEKVLAWLTAHGATVHTGPLSQVTTVQGVRILA